MTTGEISYTSDGNGNISITNMPAGMNASTDISGISIIKNGATAESKPLNDNFLYLDALITSAKTDMITQEATFTSNITSYVDSSLTDYVDITVISNASGDTNLNNNKIYRITTSGDTRFILPTITGDDVNKFNQIYIQLNLVEGHNINLNTSWGFNNAIPIITTEGTYGIVYEYINFGTPHWVCGINKFSEVS